MFRRKNGNAKTTSLAGLTSTQPVRRLRAVLEMVPPRGKKLSELARDLGISTPSLIRWVAGARHAPEGFHAKLTAAIGVAAFAFACAGEPLATCPCCGGRAVCPRTGLPVNLGLDDSPTAVPSPPAPCEAST